MADAARAWPVPPVPPVNKLVVLSLSDSFSSMWSTLADQTGLAYTPIDAPAGFDRLTASVGVISAGGAEEEL